MIRSCAPSPSSPSPPLRGRATRSASGTAAARLICQNRSRSENLLRPSVDSLGRESFEVSARILVVDDVPANVKLLEARLSAEYFDVLTAANGAEALKICERAEC